MRITVLAEVGCVGQRDVYAASYCETDTVYRPMDYIPFTVRVWERKKKLVCTNQQAVAQTYSSCKGNRAYFQTTTRAQTEVKKILVV